MIVGFDSPPESFTGPHTFKKEMIKVLRRKGHKVVYKKDNKVPDIAYVFQGTSNLEWLIECKVTGCTVVQRLDGLNWRHLSDPDSIGHIFMGEMRNIIASIVRKYIADKVIYQSEFIYRTWNDKKGKTDAEEAVIYNGTDIDEYKPGNSRDNKGTLKLVSVEGKVQEDTVTINTLLTINELEKVERIKVLGGVSSRVQNIFSDKKNVKFTGQVRKNKVKEELRASDAFLCLEINPPCPNSVIEAMASGLPIIGFDTGSLTELVPPDSGSIAPYTADPWKLELPNFELLEKCVNDTHNKLSSMRKAARCVAVERYNIKTIVEQYLKFGLQ